MAATVCVTGCKDDSEDDLNVGPSDVSVYINEVCSSGTDWVELYNPSDEEASLAGFRLQDNKGTDEEYIFPDGAAIAVTNDQAEAVVRDVLALQYTACADYAPASLADYGLDQPLYTLTLTYTEEIASDSDSSDASESQPTEKTFTLYLGNVDDSGSVCAFQEGGVQVGLVSSTAYDALLSALADLTAAG